MFFCPKNRAYKVYMNRAHSSITANRKANVTQIYNAMYSRVRRCFIISNLQLLDGCSMGRLDVPKKVYSEFIFLLFAKSNAVIANAMRAHQSLMVYRVPHSKMQADSIMISNEIKTHNSFLLCVYASIAIHVYWLFFRQRAHTNMRKYLLYQNKCFCYDFDD